MLWLDNQALTARFVAQWSTGVTVLYDNAPAQELDPKMPWVRFMVQPGASQHYLGSSESGKQLQLGRVWLEVFVPLQSGLKGAIELVDAFGDIFRHWRSEGDTLSCDTPQVSTIGQSDGFYQVNVSVPYQSIRAY